MLVGIDDTDSPAGGCTTHFALEAACAFRREHGLVLRSMARLVRLNPNIPWKTRGNAAVALDLGGPSGGPTETVGVAFDGTEIRRDRAARDVEPSPGHAATLDALIGKWCDLGASGTDPAYVISTAPLAPSLYEEAVKGVVEPASVRAAVAGLSPAPLWKALGDGRGIVGACAAAAVQLPSPTFELIVYREQSRWGTKRRVDFDSVERMDRAFPSTYQSVDRVNRHAAVAPSTPCPVLFGVRAFASAEIRAAAASVDAGEPWAGWLLFETNQGTDAHVVDSTLEAAKPLQTVRVSGLVTRAPRRLAGGHVVFGLKDGAGATADCAAFEPTKEFRHVVESLAKGDRVRAVGALREAPRTINLEKIEVLATAPRPRAATNPVCPSCGNRMKSAGADAPFRCRACGRKAPKSEAGTAPAPAAPAVGWYEVPVCARRHLARPLAAPRP